MCNHDQLIEEIRKSIDPEIYDFVQECLAKEHPESHLIEVLHRIQDKYGYLSEDHQYAVSHWLGVPTADVSGVATFYHYFRLQPRGKYAISVCLGTACFVKGADHVLDAFKNELGITLGETSNDGMFSLEGTRCIGVCALAPVVLINNQVFSNVKPAQVPDMIAKATGKG